MQLFSKTRTPPQSGLSEPSQGVSIILQGNGDKEFQRWVARRDGKTLWQLETDDPHLWSQKNGVTFVRIYLPQSIPCSQFIVVDNEGVIRSRFGVKGGSDPKTVLRDENYLAFNLGFLATGAVLSRKEAVVYDKWIRKFRTVILYDTRTFKALWEKPEVDIGQPISLINGKLTCLKILNISECFLNNWRQDKKGFIFVVKPRIAAVERDALTGRALRCATLALTAEKAKNLYWEILGFDQITPDSVVWSHKSVRIEGLKGLRGYILNGRL